MNVVLRLVAGTVLAMSAVVTTRFIFGMTEEFLKEDDIHEKE